MVNCASRPLGGLDLKEEKDKYSCFLAVLLSLKINTVYLLCNIYYVESYIRLITSVYR